VLLAPAAEPGTAEQRGGQRKVALQGVHLSQLAAEPALRSVLHEARRRGDRAWQKGHG